MISRLFFALLFASSVATQALADNNGGERHWWAGWGGNSHNEGHGSGREFNGAGGGPTSAPPQYQKECAACHMAYPAGLLPSGSWQHLMNNLGQHFGNDASVDATSANVITQYLTSHSGTYKRVSEMPPQDRITTSYWFARKHDRHVSASTWSRAAIGTRGNCEACHPGAVQGNFNEHSVRIPG